MKSLYGALNVMLGEGSQRTTMATLNGTRRINLERDAVNIIGVNYRDTRLLTAYASGDIQLTMHGWYTLNSKEIMNSQLPATIRVEFITPPGGHDLHKYAHVYLAQPTADGKWAWEGRVLLEGVAREGIVVTPTTYNAATDTQFYAFTQPTIQIKPLVEYNNRVDDEIDRYLGPVLAAFFENPDAWEQMSEAAYAEYNNGHMMRGGDVLRMLESGVLDAPVLLAGMRYDRVSSWRHALADMMHHRNLREIRNSLRVFLHWILLTGPVLLRRGERPRPLSLDEYVTFDA